MKSASTIISRTYLMTGMVVRRACVADEQWQSSAAFYTARPPRLHVDGPGAISTQAPRRRASAGNTAPLVILALASSLRNGSSRERKRPLAGRRRSKR
jgi:hypothetical protein